MTQQEISGWVESGNVRTMMRWLAHFVGYTFDDSDWEAVSTGLRGTDSGTGDGWYDYPISGTPDLTVWLAENPGAAPVSVRVVGATDAVLVGRIETLVGVLAEVHPAP